ncbi:uncharacterized protein LOC114260514 [Camellia sinensis]|uniref:uncharacterized protein LOC114260514 n=1 Tax=Camellia sinensis TaxID=4442 RepID=UPI0010369BA7|nr:uncharacterized protein LOC114260514 [Camellia sinensis]
MYLSSALLLVTPKQCEDLYLYLVVSQHAISAVLVRAEGIQNLPIFYMSKTLLRAESRYLSLEKLALALMMASRKLPHYFHAHTIVVLTESPLKALFERADFSGRILKWVVELGQFNVKLQPQTTIKAQALADFVVKFSPGVHPICPVDLTDAIELSMVSLAEVAQPLMQPNVKDDAEVARPSTDPLLKGPLQPSNAPLDLEMTGQPVGSNTASPKGDEDMFGATVNGELAANVVEQL